MATLDDAIAAIEAHRAEDAQTAMTLAAASEQAALVPGLRSRVEELLIRIDELEHPVPELGPVSFPDVAAMKASGLFRIPDDANPVVWHHGNQTLEEVFSTLGPNDLLVLPERPEPYLVDASEGFRAAGVSKVDGPNGSTLPIVSKFKGKTARTWFAMARATKGILGLGPGAVIEMTGAPTSAPWMQPQIPDKDTKTGDPGRFYYNLSGTKVAELKGAAEKVIEVNSPNGYCANFTMRGRDLGGVAYSAIAFKGGTAERLDLDGAWRGFAAVPNGETGALTFLGGTYLVSRCSTSPLDETGKRVGASPIMVNRSTGGRWEHGVASQARAGMPTIWASSGVHEWVDVVSRWGVATCVNLEECADGFVFRWTGGAAWANRNGKGGHPSPDGIYGTQLHIGLNALGRATIELVDVDLDASAKPGLTVQLYGASVPSKVKATCTQAGQPVPVTAYGTNGVVTLAPS